MPTSDVDLGPDKPIPLPPPLPQPAGYGDSYDARARMADMYLTIANERRAKLEEDTTPAEYIAVAQVHATLAQARAARDLADALSQTVPL